ncbi:MAG: flagellar biosynthesis anti-sigma factor FlgM [Spirochaetales bacterium]|nr:flagellar biosynthesis anti-sigma factor FlgM [Spirochaetales bacterium]MBP7262890.1 flagellar biosynthesis anti-sigma factor FlgM [Spirochaetia bacterium]
MTIDRLNPLDPIQTRKPAGPNRTERASRSDSVNLSSEALEKAELFQAMELAKAAPDERTDLIAELKARIDDPNYINDAVLSVTADRILDQLL